MARGSFTTETRLARREEVAKHMAVLTRGSPVVERLAEELGCSTSTIWEDRSWIIAQAAKAQAALTPEQIGIEYLTRLRSAQAAAAADGAHGAVMSGFAHEAKVLGVNAAEKVDVSVKADAQPLPPALYELLETVWRENQAGELEGTARELWARIERAMSGPEVVEVKRVE